MFVRTKLTEMPEARSKTFDWDFYGAVWEYPVFPLIGFLVFLVAGGAGGRQPEPFTISSLCFHPFLGRARLQVESALWSHVCVVIVVVEPPPGWLTPLRGWLPPPHVMDGWGARPLRWLSVLVFSVHACPWKTKASFMSPVSNFSSKEHSSSNFFVCVLFTSRASMWKHRLTFHWSSRGQSIESGCDQWFCCNSQQTSSNGEIQFVSWWPKWWR